MEHADREINGDILLDKFHARNIKCTYFYMLNILHGSLRRLILLHICVADTNTNNVL